VAEDDFISAFDELLKKDMPAKQCLEMIKSEEILISHFNNLKRTQRTIVEKYAKKKDSGEIVLDDKNNIVFKSKADEDKCKKEIGEIREEFIEIPLTNKVKIYEDDIFTARKLVLLKEVVDVVKRDTPEEPKK
jgi:hypothetical protein